MTVQPGDRLWQMPFANALACLVAFFYGLYALRLQAPQPARTLPSASLRGHLSGAGADAATGESLLGPGQMRRLVPSRLVRPNLGA
jgi:hypothetical protein